MAAGGLSDPPSLLQSGIPTQVSRPALWESILKGPPKTPQEEGELPELAPRAWNRNPVRSPEFHLWLIDYRINPPDGAFLA